MKTISATDFARNLSRILDQLEHGGEEIVITRARHPIAKISPGAPKMNALDAFADLYGVLTQEEGRAWEADIQQLSQSDIGELKDPWES